MREVKFRGKRVDNKQWVYGYLVKLGKYSFSDAERYGVVDKAIPVGFGSVVYNIEIAEVIPETVGQYTGLNDKNNIEIYDNDIVKCLEVTNTDISEYVSDVYWNNCYFGVHQSNTCDVDLGLFDSTELAFECPITEIEVVGNIYDNPELLKQ
jgi:uncharacterized phage protein (TIGR01671 family)